MIRAGALPVDRPQASSEIRMRLLVVEDNPELAQLLAKGLNAAGFEVDSATTADDARSAFNLGIGMVVVCDEASAGALAADLARRAETVFRIGEVVAGDRGVEWSD